MGNLVYALWQEVPKLLYAFWTLQPVIWECEARSYFPLLFVIHVGVKEMSLKLLNREAQYSISF